MSYCPACGTENPEGSKFCAKCGKPVPVPPPSAGPPRCPSCGAESPAGSLFCKECGKPVGGPSHRADPPLPFHPVTPFQRAGSGAGPRQGSLSESLSKVRMLLWSCVGLFAVGIFLNYTQLSQIQALYGQFAAQAPGTETTWFLIILDIVLGGLSGYAAMQLGKGNLKLAKGVLTADAAIGAVAFLLFFKGGIIPIVLNGGLAFCGVYGRMLVSREETPIV